MNFGELVERAREWWDDMDTENRYYAMIIALTVLSTLSQFATPTETRMRVRIVDK